MVAPPFTVGLRLSVEVPDGLGEPEPPTAMSQWRDALTSVAVYEPTSRRLPTNVRPSEQEATNELSQTFADHPMVNVSLTLEPGGTSSRLPDTRGKAFVIAEIVLLPDLAPVPPGGEFPDFTDDAVAPAVLIHAVRWPHERGSTTEHTAAEEFLQQIATGLPRERWRQDG